MCVCVCVCVCICVSRSRFGFTLCLRCQAAEGNSRYERYCATSPQPTLTRPPTHAFTLRCSLSTVRLWLWHTGWYAI